MSANKKNMSGAEGAVHEADADFVAGKKSHPAPKRLAGSAVLIPGHIF
jgi:hypothetical protein